MFRNDQNPTGTENKSRANDATGTCNATAGVGATSNADAFHEEVRGELAARIGGFPAADLLMEDKGGVGHLVRTAQRHGGTPHHAADMIVDAVASQLVHEKLRQRETLKKMAADGDGGTDSFEAFLNHLTRGMRGR